MSSTAVVWLSASSYLFCIFDSEFNIAGIFSRKGAKALSAEIASAKAGTKTGKRTKQILILAEGINLFRFFVRDDGPPNPFGIVTWRLTIPDSVANLIRVCA